MGVLVCAGLLVAACGDDDDGGTAEPAETTAGGETETTAGSVAIPHFDPTTKKPGPSQIGIESECPLYQSLAFIRVANDKRKGHSRRTECNRVILAQLRC